MGYRDPDAQRAYAKKHYEANKALYKARARAFTDRTRQENRQRLWDYLTAHPCVDCGEGDPVVLDFDHCRGAMKDFNIGDVLHKGYSWERVVAEIAKCEVRCANCHRRRTSKQFGWFVGA